MSVLSWKGQNCVRECKLISIWEGGDVRRLVCSKTVALRDWTVILRYGADEVSMKQIGAAKDWRILVAVFLAY